MFSKRRERFQRTVSLRLTAWYCGFFALSLFTLFLLLHATLASTLKKKDREIITAKLKLMSAEYKEKGIPELREVTVGERSSTYLIRVCDAGNRTLFINAPDPEDFPPELIKSVENQSPVENRWITVTGPHRAEVEIENSKTGDGSILQVGRSTTRRHSFLKHFREVCALVVIPMILLAIGGSMLVAHRALTPIHRLNDAVHAILNTGNIDQRISPLKTAGELRELVLSFNQMLERIDALIAGMRSVLDNVAHDLRTPLTRLRGIAEVALQNPRDVKAAQEALADCIEESDRVLTMLNTLMDISEAETGAMRLDLTKVNVGAIAADVVDLYRDVAEEKNIELSISPAAEWFAMADENRLRQAIANLVDNALKYTPPHGQVCIEIQRIDSHVIIGVRDTGVGIPRDEIAHVWERLYRGDKSRSQRGLGLGLSLVKAIAHAHAGRCEVVSAPGEGSLFRLHLPLAA